MKETGDHGRFLGAVLALVFGLLAVPAEALMWHEKYGKAKRLMEGGECQEAIRQLDRCIQDEPQPEADKPTGIRFNKVDYFPYLQLAKAHLLCGNEDLARQALAESRERLVAPEVALAEIERQLRPAPPPTTNVARSEPPPPRPPIPPPPPPPPPSPPPPPARITLAFGERLEIACAGACRFVNEDWHLEAGGKLVRLPPGPVDVKFGEDVVGFEVPYSGRLDDHLEALRQLIGRSSETRVSEKGLRATPTPHLLAVLLFADGALDASSRRAARRRFEELVGCKTLAWQRELNRLLTDLGGSSER